MEFGTGGTVDVPSGLEEYAIQWKGQGVKQINITPQPFFISCMEKKWLEVFRKFREKLVKDGVK